MIKVPKEIKGQIVAVDDTITHFVLSADGDWSQSGQDKEILGLNVDLLEAMSRHLTRYLTKIEDETDFDRKVHDELDCEDDLVEGQVK